MTTRRRGEASKATSLQDPTARTTPSPSATQTRAGRRSSSRRASRRSSTTFTAAAPSGGGYTAVSHATHHRLGDPKRFCQSHPKPEQTGSDQAGSNQSQHGKTCQEGCAGLENHQNATCKVNGLENLRSTAGGLGQLATDGRQSSGSNTECPRARLISGGELLSQENQCHRSRWQLETLGLPPKPLRKRLG